MKKIFLFIVIFALSLVSCSPGGPHKPVEGVREDGAGGVGYNQVRPIFAKYCSACHPSRSGPDWLDYNQAKSVATSGRLMERAVHQRSMPPPGSPQAASISDRERQLIAAWVKAGAPRSGGGPAENGAPASNQPSIVQRSCVHCHGSGDPTAQPKIPRLVGQSEEYLLLQLQRFKWRERLDPSGSMNDVALGLSAAEMSEAARFYGSKYGHLDLAPVNLSSEEKPLFDSGRRLAADFCVSCHLNPSLHGRPTDPSIPVLAGQAREYLMSQLIFYRANARLNPLMHEMARILSNRDIESLATYFSRTRPRR